MSAVELVKGFEGCSLVAYHGAADPDGLWTIGYGTTFYPDGSRVSEGDAITIEEADHYLEQHIEQFASIVDHQVQVDLNANQRDALTSLVYNIGSNAFQRSTLLALLNQGDYDGASKEIVRWDRAHNVENQGLLNRRLKEQELFNTPVAVAVAAPVAQPVVETGSETDA